MNPTVAVFEQRMANLEGGCGAVAFASGIAAQAAALFTLLQPGDHVVSSSALYGGTVNQFKHLLRKMNVELTWVDPDDPDAWRKEVRANTKAFFGETIGNPAGNVLDIETLATIAHAHELASNVTYPGLPGSRYRPLVRKYLPRGAGAVFSFDCAGGRTGGQDLIRGMTLWSHLANVGDAKSLVIHPASTTHRQLSDDELTAAGISAGTIRLSVGLESAPDLIADLETGLRSVAQLRAEARV